MHPLPDALRFCSPEPLIDIGANLTHESFDKDRDAVLARALEAGVEALVLTGTDRHSIESALALIEARHTPSPRLFATAGVHPHHAADWGNDYADLIREALDRPGMVAVGECGLDFNRDFSPRDAQRRAFEAQLEIAAERRLPLFLHERDASATMLEMLRSWRDDIEDAVVHCFTGDRQTLYAYLDLDLHIGLTGWLCDERRGLQLRELVGEIPLERLMIETDCPYLLPRNLPAKLKGRRHEPALLPWIAREVAALRGLDEATLARAATRTTQRFFRLDDTAQPAAIGASR
ncbi:TatD family hydrolase [Halotalea alkalilenta]|uniref:TatD family hydrolase n=1 Tax=Halotalea alkalilenta TaxID=376489 RepID=UPI000481BEFB|nr:TatD family hydrolase [Halotalea alkalilenta]